MKRRIVPIALVVVLAGAIIFFMVNGRDERIPPVDPFAAPLTAPAMAPAQPSATPVRVARAAERTIVESLRLHGTFLPNQDVAVTPKVPGLVDAVHATYGDFVAQGALLAKLDDDEHQIRIRQAEAGLMAARASLARLKAGSRPEEIDQARAQVAQARAALDQTASQLSRARALHESGAVTQAELEQVETQFDVAQAQLSAALSLLAIAEQGPLPEDISAAEAQVAQAKAALDLARLQAEHTQITAPIAGIIADRAIDPGDYAAPGHPVFRIVQIDPIVIRVEVGGRDIGKVRVGQDAEITSPAFPGARFPGRVDAIEATADGRSGLFGVRIAVPNADGRLRPGMSGEARILLFEAEEALSVPNDALLRDGDGFIVYVADDGIARRHEVTTGASDGAHTQILSGLAPDEWVIVGQRSLVDGAAIQITGRDDR